MMNIIQDIIERIDLFFSKNELEEIASRDITIAELNEVIDSLKAESEVKDILLKDTLKQLNDANSSLHNYVIKELQEKESKIAEEYWNKKYPIANITYTGRTFGPSNNMIPIDVRLLITPQDFHIHDILRQNNLYVVDGDYETKVPKIYSWIRNNMYSYEFDQQVFGVSEFWEFPFEILEGQRMLGKKGYDCDSWANLQASFYIAAGVPAWKVRVVIGNCQLGGHSTVYVHSDVDNKFHHLNSTYGNADIRKISLYPLSSDAETTDKLGIKNVWFSFNNLLAWHKFTSEAKESFKEKANDKYKIIPL
jgi:hypothetical protein